MLRVFGAFLCVFWLLSLVVHCELAYVFGAATLLLLAIDLAPQILRAAHATSERAEAPFFRRGNPKA
jgi:hypothetical protein